MENKSVHNFCIHTKNELTKVGQKSYTVHQTRRRQRRQRGIAMDGGNFFFRSWPFTKALLYYIAVCTAVVV